MKETKVTIKCDTCTGDLSPEFTQFAHKYILEVSCLDIARSTGVCYAVDIGKPIERNLHFCGLICMKDYNPEKG